MTALVVLLALRQDNPAAILARYASYRKQVPSLSVEIAMTSGKNSLANAHLLLESNKRLLFEATSKDLTYVLSETEKGTLEISPKEGLYDEYPAIGHTSTFASRVSDLSQVLPGVLLNTAIASAKSSVKFNPEGKEVIGGVATDGVGWNVQTPTGSIHYSTRIDAKGRLIRFARGAAAGNEAEAGSAGTPVTWTFSNYKPISHPNLAMFSRTIPISFVPYAVPESSELAFEIGSPFPSIKLSGGEDIQKRVGSHGMFLLIAGEDCVPSQKLLADQAAISAAVSETGSNFAAVSLASNSKQASGLRYDVSGSLQKWLGRIPTPMMVYVTPDSKVSALWSGYDPANKASLIGEIKQAITHPKPH